MDDAERRRRERARRESLFGRTVVCPVCRGLMVPLAFDNTKQVGWACNRCPGPQVQQRISYEVRA